MKYMMFVATDSDPDLASEAPDIEGWAADVDRREIRVIR